MSWTPERKLVPCPFCGRALTGYSVMMKPGPLDTNSKYPVEERRQCALQTTFRVSCGRCGTDGPSVSVEDTMYRAACRAWSKRSRKKKKGGAT